MATSELISSINRQTREGFSLVFEQEWPKWLAGILITVLALLIFLWDSPWGIANGYRNWGNWFLYFAGINAEKPFAPWLHPMSLSNLGLFAGALASALMSRQFSIRRAPRLEYVKGLAGGVLMGIGAAFAKGCNVGGFFTAAGMLSFGGIAMMFGLVAGSWIGLQYLLWEMENIPSKPMAQGKAKTVGMDLTKIQPMVGLFVFIGAIAAFYVYSSIDKTVIGGLLFLGFLIGLVMHRSRFCFARAFRCPFMTGDSETVKVLATSLILYAASSAVIKWAWVKEPMMGVHHPFFIGSLVGGVIFGVGMILAGGCASSALWRIGEGHLKLVLTLFAFSIANAATVKLFSAYDIFSKLGSGTFIPDVLTWQFTLPLLVLFFLAWIVLARWNEESETFVIF